MMQGSEWVLERLKELQGEKHQHEEDNRRAHALTSFLRALNETEIYYGELRKSDKDRDREADLSRMWIDVSQELLIVDVELAKRCEMKAKFCADPTGWSPLDVERANIAIYEMRAALYRLMQQEEERKRRRTESKPEKRRE
jgi:hypothetical protein